MDRFLIFLLLFFSLSREKEFDEPDYRYKSRDSFKESQKSDSRDKDKGTKSSSWARDYEERLSVRNAISSLEVCVFTFPFILNKKISYS